MEQEALESRRKGRKKREEQGKGGRGRRDGGRAGGEERARGKEGEGGGGGREGAGRDCIFWGFCSKAGCNTEPRTFSLLKLYSHSANT